MHTTAPSATERKAACTLGALVAAHQADHLPWLCYFARLAKVDFAIELDCVQYNHHRFQNRNRIIDRTGRMFWLRVPVSAGKRHVQAMRDVEIADVPWRRRYLEAVRHAYGQHPYFTPSYARLVDVIGRPWTHLLDLNRGLRLLFLEWLEIETPIALQSELALAGHVREPLLLASVGAVGGSRFLSGPTGRSFLDSSAFERAGVDLAFDPVFEAKRYPQWGLDRFVPDLSALDLVMNLGSDAAAWLRENHVAE